MKSSLFALALLGNIEAETLDHKSYYYEPSKETSGLSRLVNETDIDIAKMKAKPEWTSLPYGPYEQKKFAWDKKDDKKKDDKKKPEVKSLTQLDQPVYFEDGVDRESGPHHPTPKPVIDKDYYGYGDQAGQFSGTLAQLAQPVYLDDVVDRASGPHHPTPKPVIDKDYYGYGDQAGQFSGTLAQRTQPVYLDDNVDRESGPHHPTPKPVIDNDYYGYGDSAGQNSGTLAQKLRFVPSAGITLVQVSPENEINLDLNSQWKINANKIYDADGDGIEDNKPKTPKQLDEFYKPAVMFPTENVENTQHGNLPGHLQYEFEVNQVQPQSDDYTLVRKPWAMH